jgi:cytochrome c553
MHRNALSCFAVLASIAALAACNKSAPAADDTPSSEPATTTTTTQAVAEGNAVSDAKAREIFNTRCATCHGAQGRGDGPGAITLTPKPRNYHDKAWQAKVTDDDIKKTIQYGGAAVGKSPMMPASPDLDSKPEVIEGLVKIVRNFGKE